MATLLKCDLCDNISPNKEGLHVANDWTHVELRQHRQIGTHGVHDGKIPRLTQQRVPYVALYVV